MKRLSFAATPVALAALVACQRAPGPLSAADEAALRGLDSAFAAAANAGNVEGLTALYAAGATVLPLYMPPAQGTDAIRQLWTGMLAQGRPSLQLTSTKIEGRGDLAYLIGNYRLSVTPAEATAPAPPPEDGKYLVVAMRQADGSWKWVADIWNPNSMPTPPPPSPAGRPRGD